MLVLPKGLLQGERLANCGDEAQLHFPRLAAVTNGFGRIELNLRTIIETAYASFSVPPSYQQLTGWFKEYESAHLLFIYLGPDGKPWGQWRGTPDNMLPRYKTAADKRSPAPPLQALSKFDKDYADLKMASGDFLNVLENFGKIPKSSGDSGGFQNISADEVVDEVIDEAVDEGKQLLTPPLTAAASRKTRNGRSAKPYDPGFLIAFGAYPKHDEKSESEREYLEAIKRLTVGERDKEPMSRENAEAFLRIAAEDYARKMAAENREQAKIRSMRRWLFNSTYLDFTPKPRVEYIELSPDESSAQWERDFGRAAHA